MVLKKKETTKKPKSPNSNKLKDWTWEKNTRPYIARDGIDSIKLINYLNRGKLNIKTYRQTVRGLKERD